VAAITTVKDLQALSVRAARETERLLQRAQAERGVAHLALSGGGTPVGTYELLAASELDWGDIHVWFADERCVPAEDEQSNYRLAREALLERVPIAAERVHRMEGELGPQRGAERYEQALRSYAPMQEGLAVLDVLVLGIGPDGHVASLFPNQPTLEADELKLCLGVHDSPKPPPERITLSLSVLRAAGRGLLLVAGSEKASALARALCEHTPEIPASLLERDRLTVIADDAAAPSENAI
jgi:6-phosphogluconolactonase